MPALAQIALNYLFSKTITGYVNFHKFEFTGL